MTEYKDKTIKCVDCGTEFVFTARDQEFYQEKVLQMNQKDAKLVVIREKQKKIISKKNQITNY